MDSPTKDIYLPQNDCPAVSSSQQGAIVVVDPWSTGNKLCELILSKGYELVLVWEDENVRSPHLKAKHVIMHDNKAKHGKQETLSKLKQLQSDLDIICIIPGSETGVILAEDLAYRFGSPTNPPKLAEARRNKYLMGEAVRAAGVRAVQQTIATEWQEVVEFLSSFKPNPFKIVVKPNLGAGSDDVFMCESMEQVKNAFFKINGNINSLGIKNDGVLIQEFLQGKEYVVDTMSRNGEHKVIMMWQYDKREANNRFNVYHGTRPEVVTGEIQHSLRQYVLSVLDALEVRNGPGHAEVIMTPTGPCLVEIGCRCHGGNASWYPISNACVGRDQLNAVIDGFANEEEFRKYPDFATSYDKYGACVDLIGYDCKKIIDIPGLEFSKSLKSFHRINLFKSVGDTLEITVDCNTPPGEVLLIHEDREQVERDFASLHEMMKCGGFFTLQEQGHDSCNELDGSCLSSHEESCSASVSSFEG